MNETLTRAPMTPREVSLKYSNGRVLEVVLRNGYKNKGMWAKKNRLTTKFLVKGIQTCQEELPSFWMRGYTLQERQRIANTIRSMCRQCRRIKQGINRHNFLQQGGHDTYHLSAIMTRLSLKYLPKECHKTRARSSNCSRFLLNSSKAPSRVLESSKSITSA